MTGVRVIAALCFAAAMGVPTGASAMSLPEAIAMAKASNPSLAQAKAGADAADARLTQARAGGLPSVAVSGQSGWGSTDLGGFFGFGRSTVSPRGAALEVRQPLFAGGAIVSGIDRAREGRDAALAQVAGARATLTAQVAEAYVAVQAADQMADLQQAQVGQFAELVRQSALKFNDGEVPRSELDQARARLAGAKADLARIQADQARSRAHFAALVGAEPAALEPPPAPPAVPASLDEAMTIATEASPSLRAAQAAARAAGAGVRVAQAERYPSVALAASASSVRDQFFPGYRDQGMTVGVQGRWTLFSGGLVTGKIREAGADARAADAALDAARAQVTEAVIGAWQDLRSGAAAVVAADDQSAASDSALDSVRNEVRVGQKPALDLLDAERDALAARDALIVARAQQVVAAYRLNALLGRD